MGPVLLEVYTYVTPPMQSDSAERVTSRISGPLRHSMSSVRVSQPWDLASLMSVRSTLVSGTQRFMLVALVLVLAIVVGVVVVVSSGDDDNAASNTTSEVGPLATADTECAAVPELSEIGANPNAYPDLGETILSSVLCWDLGSIRPIWPDGLTLDDALAFTDRVCSAPGVAPPTPQEWYDAVDGPSTGADDFAAAIVNHVDASRSGGVGVC